MYYFRLGNFVPKNLKIISIHRKASILDTQDSARNIRGEMIRDIIGTYYNYTVSIARSQNKSSTEYDQFYEMITSPKPSWELEILYGQKTITFNAYITATEDEIFVYDQKRNFVQWNGLNVDFIAMKPYTPATNQNLNRMAEIDETISKLLDEKRKIKLGLI